MPLPPPTWEDETMKRQRHALVLAAVLMMCFSHAFAQSGGGFDLSWWTIDGGGVTFALGTPFQLGGTVGQPDASNALTGGAFSLTTSGFWFQPCLIHDGDVDVNGCIDDADLLAVLFAFGNTGYLLGRVDVNCDQVVDDADLLTVLFNFGRGC
jgi:hypothetical protein